MEGAAQSILTNAGQLLSEEYRLLSSVGGDVAELRDDMATMNALLRMQSEAEDGAMDHFIREWMKQLREVAYDAEDCVDHYKLRIKSRPNDGVGARLERLFGTLLPRRRLACEIKALRARAIAISERHARYGVNRDALLRATSFAPPVLAASSASEQPLDRANHPGNQQVVALGDQAANLAKQVMEPVEHDTYFKVFSIVGFGGVGKTTLAMEVCRLLQAEFQRQAMVSVSQAFQPTRDLKVLLKRVLHQVVKEKTDNVRGIKEEDNLLAEIDKKDETGLKHLLKNLLKDKRYLIVIDDVWTIGAWDAIQSVLPENNCDSRIIVTTRIDTVAKACSPARVSGHYIHHMKPLELDDSKKLFLSKAFGSENADYPVELKDVMDNILKKCGGLPLAIVSIASFLAGYRTSGSKEKWDTICKSIGSQMESNPTLEGMKNIVILSYNHLPHELKSCMMYLSIFPEDYEINKDRLLRRWIAEGLIPEKRGLTLMEVATSYLDELVSRNMVQPHFGYDGMIESCRVHDMLLEVMVSKSLESNFVSLIGGQYEAMSYDRIRRLSVHSAVVVEEEEEEEEEETPRKKIAAFWSKKKEATVGRGTEGMDVKHARSLTMFQNQGHHKLLDHLDKFSLLRVLDLEDCEGLRDYHMKHVCRLYLLRFLSVKGTNVTKLPRQVEKLEHLQTLDGSGACLCGLPETITKLEKLERIEFSHKTDWKRMWNLPPGLKKMKALCEVGIARLDKNVQVAQELSKLQKLQSFNVYVDCEDDPQVFKALADSLSNLYSLRRLSISNNERSLAFLRDMASPRLLRYLRLEGHLHELPGWVGSLTYLVEIVIMHTNLAHDLLLFGVLCKLPNLNSIVMDRACYSGEQLVARTGYKFPVLSSLVVNSDWIQQPKVFSFEEGSMEKLESLHINFGRIERKIVGIEHLTSLKEVGLIGKQGNPSLERALQDLQAKNSERQNQFQVALTYY